MMRATILACLVGVALSLPSRTKDTAESFGQHVLEAKPHTETSLKENMAKRPLASAWENREGRNAVWNIFGLNWRGGVIYYEFGDISEQQRLLVLSLMDVIESFSCVRFQPRTDEFDYVKITNYTNGCHADLGYTRCMGEHILNISPDECSTTYAVYRQLSNVMGFSYMHQANRRDQFVKINWDNIEPGREEPFYAVGEAYSDLLGLPYDYESIMHLGPYAYSRNGQRTIDPVDPNVLGIMGQQTHITGLDILRVNRLYRCEGSSYNRDLEAKPFYWPSEEELLERGRRFADRLENRVRMPTQLYECA